MLHLRRSHLRLASVVASLALGAVPLSAQDFTSGFAMRFTTSGVVDPDFGPAGVLGGGVAQAAAVDGVNHVFVAGTRGSSFVVTRLTSDGTIDANFGVNGEASRSFPAPAEARAVAIDSGGRILVAGTSDGRFALACFNPLGGLCAFGGIYSKVTTAFSCPAEGAAIAIASDGHILVGGRVSCWDSLKSAKNEMFALARYTTTGQIDTSFGSGGLLTRNVAPAGGPNVETINAMAIDSSGRIIAAGAYAAQNVAGRFAVLRWLANGAIDSAFGPNGSGLVTNFASCSWAGCFEEAWASSLVLQSDGKIVVAGSVRRINTGNLAFDVGLVRLLPDGARDSGGFGIDGYVVTDLGGYEEARSLARAGSSLYVAGFSQGGERTLVARYSASDGSLDTAFNGGTVEEFACGVWNPGLAVVVQTFTRGFATIRKPVVVGFCLQ